MAKETKGKMKFGSNITNIILVAIIIIAVNVIAASIYFRWDITEEKLYTLSEGTENIVKDIKTPISIKYYFTKNLEGLPMTYKNYGQKIDEILKEYQNLNPEMISYESFEPEPDSDEEEWAQKYGLSGVDLGTGERAFMGVVAIQEDNEVSLPFMDPRREQFLEYDITQMLVQTYQIKDKTIGLISSLPVMGTTPNRMQQMQGQRPMPQWAFMAELEKAFKIESLATDVADIPESIDILLVIHPKNLKDSTQYAIDQFVLRGGELVVLVDPNSRIEQATAAASQMGPMASANSDLSRLFKHWGVKYDAGKVLGDLDHPTRVNAGSNGGVISYALWHSLSGDSFNKDLIATKGLESMMIIEPGGFTMEKESSLELNSLLLSSQRSGLIDSYLTRYGDPVSTNKSIVPDNTSYTLAGILTGQLTSAFSSRPQPAADENNAEAGTSPSQPTNPLPHVGKSAKSAKILLITDADFIADTFSVERFNLLGQTLIQPKNDNLNFIVNMIEFLGGAETMMKIRSRGRFTRPFDRFETLLADAQSQYQEAEEKLSANLKEVQEKLSRLNVEKGTNKVVLTKEQIDQIKQFREEEKKTKSELREIRKLLRQDIEFEKTSLTLVNLLLVPVLLTVIGLFIYYRRVRSRN